MTNVQSYSGAAADDSCTAGRLTNFLGWFSIGLGVTELIAPGALGNLIGVRSRPKTRTVMRLYGLREIAAGIGILTQPRPAGWLWARVAGDGADLSSLAAALRSRRNDKGRVSFAMASVIGVAWSWIDSRWTPCPISDSIRGRAFLTSLATVTVLASGALTIWRPMLGLPSVRVMVSAGTEAS